MISVIHQPEKYEQLGFSVLNIDVVVPTAGPVVKGTEAVT
jgi:hypothetical protein